jgi:hypothetical protein
MTFRTRTNAGEMIAILTSQKRRLQRDGVDTHLEDFGIACLSARPLLTETLTDPELRAAVAAYRSMPDGIRRQRELVRLAGELDGTVHKALRHVRLMPATKCWDLALAEGRKIAVECIEGCRTVFKTINGQETKAVERTWKPEGGSTLNKWVYHRTKEAAIDFIRNEATWRIRPVDPDTITYRPESGAGNDHGMPPICAASQQSAEDDAEQLEIAERAGEYIAGLQVSSANGSGLVSPSLADGVAKGHQWAIDRAIRLHPSDLA